MDNCAEAQGGIQFTLTSGLGDIVHPNNNGEVLWEEVLAGPIGIQEAVPAGFGEPVVFCDLDGTWTAFPAPNGYISHEIPPGGGFQFTCHWFNIPEEPNDVTIYKWLCPEGFDPYVSNDVYFDNCTQALDGIAFTLSSDLGLSVLDTVGGVVGFGELPSGMIGVQETIPPEYSVPYVVCEIDGNWLDMGASTGYFEYEFEARGEHLVCHWFNIPGEPGDVTIYKWTCPEGYDLYVEGADPKIDCTGATNGVEFQFGKAGDGELAEIQETGELIEGGVVFGSLEPDTYKAVELVPEGIDHVFVLECTGHIMGQLQPYPLEMGNVLEIDVAAGEHLTCHWFNVPGHDPQDGSLTVIKYLCATGTFVTEVDCEIYEGGQGFDLSYWDGDSYEFLDSAVTDGVGRIGWSGLTPGTYWLDEIDGEWCHVTTSIVPEDDLNGFIVNANEETVVTIYNCGGEPGKPGDTPTKYPNTGVPPRKDPRFP